MTFHRVIRPAKPHDGRQWLWYCQECGEWALTDGDDPPSSFDCVWGAVAGTEKRQIVFTVVGLEPDIPLPQIRLAYAALLGAE